MQLLKPWLKHVWPLLLLPWLSTHTNILHLKQVFVWSELLPWVEKDDTATRLDEGIAADTVCREYCWSVLPDPPDRTYISENNQSWQFLLENKNIPQVYTWICFIFQAAPVTADNTWAAENQINAVLI